MLISYKSGCYAILASLCLVCWGAGVLSAAPPSKWSALDKAVGKESYLEAKKLADAILQRGAPEDRVKALKVYGRILLALGQKESARQYLTMLSKPGADPTGGKLTTIYTAWFKALDGKPEDGIKDLKKIVEQAGSSPDETIAEAADVLAMLYMACDEQENAKKAVDAGLKALRYRGTKSGYVFALLHGRLKSNFTSGWPKRMYDKAESLRQKGKFAKAGQLFAQVRELYGNVPSPARGKKGGAEGVSASQWAHAAGFRIGQCYVGLNQPAKAIAWWRKFINETPAGPWRGQAHVALVDAVLRSQLDLKKATEFTMTATAVLAKGLGKDAEPSWKAAAHDIHLRQGVVFLVDGRFDVAAQAFQQAKQSAPKVTSRQTRAGLDRLIEIAKKRSKFIPDVLGVGDDRAVVAITLGHIYSILHQSDIAKGYFSLPLRGSTRSRSAAHRSFAGLGLARILAATGGSPSPKNAGSKAAAPFRPAIIAYKASIKEYPNGSWHDETLYCLATIIQDQADAKFGKQSKSAGSKKSDRPTRSLSPRERVAEAKAEKKRLVALLKTKAAALPYWQEIITQHPQSPRCEQAFYMIGILQVDLENWEEGLVSLDRFVETYPSSACTGEALLILGQYSLECRVDLEKSQDYFHRLDSWITQARKKGFDRSVPPLFFNTTPPRPTQKKADSNEVQTVSLSGRIVASRPRYSAEKLVECYSSKSYLDSTELDCAKLRGFLFFATGQKDEALAQYTRIMKLDAEARKVEAEGDWSDYTRLKWGLDHGYLFAYPEELARYDEQQRLAVLLADFYYVNRRFDDAAALAQRLSKAEFGLLRGEAAGYPQYLYATCIYWTRGRSEAYREYMKVLGSGTSFNVKKLSITKERAAYAAGHISLDMPDGPMRKQGKEMLRRLAFSGNTTHYAYQARIAYAGALINEGKRKEGMRLLETFPESSGKWRAIALSYIEAYREAEKNSKQEAEKNSKPQ